MLVEVPKDGGYNPILRHAILRAQDFGWPISLSDKVVTFSVADFQQFLSLILAGIKYLSNEAAIKGTIRGCCPDDMRKIWFSKVYNCRVYHPASDKWYYVDVWHDWEDVTMRYSKPQTEHKGHHVSSQNCVA